MQLSAINSQNFKGNVIAMKDFDRIQQKEAQEIEDTIKLVEALKEAEDRFSHKQDEPDKKSKVGTAVSLLLGAVVLFNIGKKGYNKASETAKYFATLISNNTKVQEMGKAVTEKIATFAQKDNKITSIAQNVAKKVTTAGSTINNKFISKVGAGNLAGGASALAGTYVVAGTDSNDNGVADIAEKGINAYKGAIQNLGVVREIVEALS